MYEEKNYSYCLSKISGKIRCGLLKLIIENTNDPKVLSVFRSYYKSTDYGSHIFSKENILKVYNYRDDAFREDINNRLSSYGDTITIYRGEADKSTPYKDAYSWSLNKGTAYFFTTRFGEDSKVITASVKKEDILDYIESDEEEVIVLSENIKILDTQEIYSLDDVMYDFDDFSNYFYDFKELIKELELSAETEAHGKIHTLRVLFFAILILSLNRYNIDIDDSDISLLCTAISYHDVGRTNDKVDLSHGEKSYNIYSETNPKCSEIEFLIKYHCIDDKVAKKFLSNTNSIPEDRKDIIWDLYSVLKDADALDRARFGVESIDYSLFRFKSSELLTKIAVQSQIYLKL